MSDTLRVGPLELEVLRRGSGRPILLVHGINPVSPHAPFLDLLAAHGEVVAPSHPGFGKSPLPEDFDTMYDLVHLYRDVLDTLPEKVVMIGFSFGGWIAAEVAVGGHPKLDRLVLVDPVGIKLGGREERDIAHFFNTNPAELARLAWHDPANRPDGVYGLGWQAAIDDTMTRRGHGGARPQLGFAVPLCLAAAYVQPAAKGWLRRIAVPTLVLWGASDGIVTPDYGRAYAGLIPRRPLRADRRGRPPSGTGAAAGLRRRGRPVYGADAMMFIIRSGGEWPTGPIST